MIKWFAQVGALISFNLRSLPQRKGAAASAMFGIALVVAVLVGVLSIAYGFRKVMVATGSPDTALILRSGADSEMTSILMRDEAKFIAEAPGIARAGGRPLVSPELFVVVNLPKKSTHTDANVPLRGVDKPAFPVHSAVKVTQGRMFDWGKNEVIVGRGALNEFAGLDIGSELHFGPNIWKVVGIFEAAGGLPESEIWADSAVLGPAYRRVTSYQTAVVKLASAGNFQKFKDHLTSDPRLNVKVLRETEYYESQSRLLYQMVTGLGSIICVLMALGAVFGALNTMYSAVSSRAREIATLEALGFGSSPVIVSILAESLVLAAIGGAIGALLAWAAFDGYQTATMNWQSFSQVTFAFAVGPRLLVDGVVYALLIGFIGGLLPAIRAARLPVSVALRQ
ncbi:MAG TPA: FtsX-like permease family protein [Thermoanaerobaculia bacterium]|nr:FtsX-like permease family protein [Thermoanaerobaculia bacterium]